MTQEPDPTRQGPDPNCPHGKYTRTRKKKNTEGTATVNAFGNGWTNNGRKRYCALMSLVNESRAFYKTSFDTRMKKYATAWDLKTKRKKTRKQSTTFRMTSEFALPSLESIVTANPNPSADLLNAELMDYDDELSDNEETPHVNETAV